MCTTNSKVLKLTNYILTSFNDEFEIEYAKLLGNNKVHNIRRLITRHPIIFLACKLALKSK